MSIIGGTVAAGMIKQYLLKKALDTSFRTATTRSRQFLREKKARLTVTREDVEASLGLHVQNVQNWCDEISFSGLKKAKLTSQVFIELDLFVIPQRHRLEDEKVQTLRFSELFEQENKHVILLGQPGAGKTTSMKRLCLALFHEEHFPHENLSFPVLVRCRDLNLTHVSLFDYIFAELGLELVLPNSLQQRDKATREAVRKLREQIVATFLDSLSVLLIVDGFDEIADEDRQQCLADIRKLAYQLQRARLVVTSRTGEFNYHIDNTAAFEIRGLDDSQIKEFARKWLQDDTKAADFVKKIKATPFIDAAIRPLTLAHLCALYERNQDVPEKPKTVYKKIVNLLLEEWDQERSIKRVSKYAQFEADRKFEFLSQLAYLMTTEVKSTVFSTLALQQVYDQIHDEYGLDSNDRQRVVAEIESHTGLFLKSGYERYEFAHKSLQEYLTAEFIVKLPSIPEASELYGLPNELAVAVAISSRPGKYFAELVFRRLRSGPMSNEFLRPFLYRLLIERPDFNSDPVVQLALLTKLSEYLDQSFVSKGLPWNFQADELLDGWENVIKRYHSQTLTGILNCYETKRIYDTRQPDLIHKLSFHQGSVPHDLWNLRSEFPKVLFVRTSVLNFRSRKATGSTSKKK